MDLDKKLELYQYIESNVKYNVDDVQFDKLDKLFNVEDLTTFYSDKPHRKNHKFKTITIW